MKEETHRDGSVTIYSEQKEYITQFGKKYEVNKSIYANIIRFVFRTKYRYSKTDQFLIYFAIAVIINWFYILFKYFILA